MRTHSALLNLPERVDLLGLLISGAWFEDLTGSHCTAGRLGNKGSECRTGGSEGRTGYSAGRATCGSTTAAFLHALPAIRGRGYTTIDPVLTHSASCLS